MTFLTIFVIVITWFTVQSIYLIIRTKTLKKSFRKSDYDMFLDFFEYEFLLKKNTWRRMYGFVYNSKLYFLVSWIAVVMSILVVALAVVFLLICYYNGWWNVLTVNIT